jgi:hypothetical protein
MLVEELMAKFGLVDVDEGLKRPEAAYLMREKTPPPSDNRRR